MSPPNFGQVVARAVQHTILGVARALRAAARAVRALNERERQLKKIEKIEEEAKAASRIAEIEHRTAEEMRHKILDDCRGEALAFMYGRTLPEELRGRFVVLDYYPREPILHRFIFDDLVMATKTTSFDVLKLANEIWKDPHIEKIIEREERRIN